MKWLNIMAVFIFLVEALLSLLGCLMIYGNMILQKKNGNKSKKKMIGRAPDLDSIYTLLTMLFGSLEEPAIPPKKKTAIMDSRTICGNSTQTTTLGLN